MIVRVRVRVRLGLLGFSLRAACVHTHHIHATCKRYVEKGLTTDSTQIYVYFGTDRWQLVVLLDAFSAP